MLKRGHQGTYRQMSANHLVRYVGQVLGVAQRTPDGHDRPALRHRAGMVGKRLRYSDLIA